nr:MAG TPA: hypothetical protein [Caudoviricetes sp.]
MGQSQLPHPYEVKPTLFEQIVRPVEGGTTLNSTLP